MQFFKSNVMLVVLVFSFKHVRSAPQDYHDAIADESNEGVGDQGVGDEGVGDIQEPDDVSVEGKDCPDAPHDDVISGENHEDHSDEELDGKTKLDLSPSDKKALPVQCKQGSYFYTDGCNICYCYMEGTQGCTDILCGKNSKTKLLNKLSNTGDYKKLRDSATGCVPGEKIEVNGCICNCVIPSVMTCDKSCAKM